MPDRNSKRLVIDTSVTSAAGSENAIHPVPKQCRECLLRVLKHEHLFVITEEIWEEWKRHRSSFASEWLTSMRARRLIYRAQEVVNNSLRAKLEKHAKSDMDREEMLKDVRLLEAAIATDKSVISLNELDRKRFQSVASRIGEIRPIVWVNPIFPEEQCLVWLENSCPVEKRRQLGYAADE